MRYFFFISEIIHFYAKTFYRMFLYILRFSFLEVISMNPLFSNWSIYSSPISWLKNTDWIHHFRWFIRALCANRFSNVEIFDKRIQNLEINRYMDQSTIDFMGFYLVEENEKKSSYTNLRWIFFSGRQPPPLYLSGSIFLNYFLSPGNGLKWIKNS